MTNTARPRILRVMAWRYIWSAKRVVVRNRIANENLRPVVPPVIPSRLYGIDMFAEAYSFVNADQFVQLLCLVAANAKGYAFQLAPQCHVRKFSITETLC